jgi:hypothetical protein
MEVNVLIPCKFTNQILNYMENLPKLKNTKTSKRRQKSPPILKIPKSYFLTSRTNSHSPCLPKSNSSVHLKHLKFLKTPHSKKSKISSKSKLTTPRFPYRLKSKFPVYFPSKKPSFLNHTKSNL